MTPWTVACPVPLSMGFSRQEDWSGLSCPPPGDLPDPGIKPTSPVAPEVQVDSLSLSRLGSPRMAISLKIIKITNIDEDIEKLEFLCTAGMAFLLGYIYSQRHSSEEWLNI